ncbi:MAG: DUF2254 domain-containing protein [Rhodobacteraceae bacterium]|jgi:uncharacterized membrane protein|nr:DUF2254 domain-containing protein [Paracoccaceae bacterium]
MPHWRWILRNLTRKLWFRATLLGLLGVAAAFFALVAERFIPYSLPGNIGADAVDSILNIIASSMLAVTTFSLSVMTSAYGAAASSVTPRATRLLVEDRLTQNVLSTFVGSFLFSIVGIVVLKTGAYGDRGRVVLFVVTIGVIALIVVMLLRWIDHLTKLGRVDDTISRVEEATRAALAGRLASPWLGGRPLNDPDQPLPAGLPVRADRAGYIQNIDMASLSDRAEAMAGDIHIVRLPGSFVHAGTVLAWVGPSPLPPGPVDDLSDAFAIGSGRSFDQDPRFGLAVLSEIASRALSPAMNDPGTAIDVIGRQARLLAFWAANETVEPAKAAEYPRLHAARLQDDDLMDDAFMPIARDGAALVEVQLRLQKALAALARIGPPQFRAAARAEAAMAFRRAEAAMTLQDDVEWLQRVRRSEGLAEP